MREKHRRASCATISRIRRKFNFAVASPRPTTGAVLSTVTSRRANVSTTTTTTTQKNSGERRSLACMHNARNSVYRGVYLTSATTRHNRSVGGPSPEGKHQRPRTSHTHRPAARPAALLSFAVVIESIVFARFQYYEMSYGLNVEMHKQVRDGR